jgi:hypothetical chaperone protein
MEVEETKIQLTQRDSRHVDLDRIEPGLRGTEPRVVRGCHRRAAGARARQRDRAAGQGRGERSQVDTVFFTGGSSGIPALRNSVSAMLPNARHVEGNIFGSIGSGLAIEAQALRDS